MSDEFSTLESQNIRLIEAEKEHYRDRDIAKLNSLAKMYGYKLVPIKMYVRYLPCVCGCNRREHWSHVSPGSAPITVLKCKKCGLVADGKTEAEAKHNWNELVKERANSLKDHGYFVQ